jgi:outer membrane usher protein FimD/PapC
LRLDSSLFRNDENTQFATSGELRTSFGVFGSGKAYIGANAEGDAQIVVDIENDAKDGTTVIEIEGGQKTKVVGSRRIVFGVTPYREYRVSISPDEDAPITDYDTKIVDVLLYPGHSQFIQFKLRRLFVAIGSLVDKDGKPMTEVVIKGAKDDIATEEDGTFQVEIAGDEVLKAQVEGGECTVQLPKLEKEPEYFHEFGEVQCLRVK